MQAEYEAGSGTFVKDTFICASLVGFRHVVPPASAADLVRDEQMLSPALLKVWVILGAWRVACRQATLQDAIAGLLATMHCTSSVLVP